MLAAVLHKIHRQFGSQWVTAKQISQLRIQAGPGPSVKLASLVYFGADELALMLEAPEFWVQNWLTIHSGYDAGEYTLVRSFERMEWRVVRAPKPSRLPARSRKVTAPSSPASRRPICESSIAEHAIGDAGKVMH